MTQALAQTWTGQSSRFRKWAIPLTAQRERYLSWAQQSRPVWATSGTPSRPRFRPQPQT
ncbi:hypothetical protein [uncultured Methanobrevibacter sp.]|uniref:hypothetical protein n=1 Tax=uncultured Methanobrevibacter sp. TaxID=253161 RepID=UPI0025E226F1|nr:hypothetical protein [uncultured Methanobrevibacter sp.]